MITAQQMAQGPSTGVFLRKFSKRKHPKKDMYEKGIVQSINVQ